ncbi:hypothetical protein LINPERPRIM_LOCUS17503 [Linum perenne]
MATPTLDGCRFAAKFLTSAIS